MNIKNLLKFLLLSLLPLFVNANKDNENQKTPKIKLYGSVKTDYYYDTRQTVGLRMENAILYPKPAVYDNLLNDLNAVPSTHFSPIQARLGVNVDEFSALGARGFAKIEGEFFGLSEQDINGFRLRHSYLSLNWNCGFDILAGQTWHPMFLDDNIPGTGSFNTGMPFNPFARNPQFRIGYTRNNFKTFLAAVTQIDMVSNGPNGPSNSYIRNSIIPELALKATYQIKNNKHSFTFGGVGTMKTLKPRTQNSKNNKVEESITTFAGLIYGKYTYDKFSAKFSAILGEDMHHLIMIGGYAIKHDDFNVNVDIREQNLSYTPLVTSSFWADFSYGKKYSIGLFTGFSKNHGSFQNIWDWTNAASYFARGRDIDHIYRIAPRFVYEFNKFRVGTELEYSAAVYGKTNNSLNQWTEVNEQVANTRALVFVQYSF